VDELTSHAFSWEERKNNVPRWVPPITSAIPVVKYGKIESIFRDEIDSFDAIQTLVNDYLKDMGRKTPLCFAVFGAPGSGKSFTVQQILERTHQDGFKNPLKFNVAQFATIRDLAVALHQVQDRVLSQQSPPLVFFDEIDTNFDAERWGWLKYFLAPMQDGEFKDGESTYRIGRAVFVFAGGISASFDSFANKKDDARFVDAKGPDFVSRLRGHLDIRGIDHPRGRIDPAVVLRRAIVLRQFLVFKRPEIMDPLSQEARIDPEVVGAFLLVPGFEHGIRSLEAIVDMSHITGTPPSFSLASIPTPKQLRMHVKEFKYFVRGAGQRLWRRHVVEVGNAAKDK
jgi:hypothetical protein